jgi:hypothetical protein
MTVSATDAAALFGALTLYELDQLVLRLTDGYQVLVISGPLFDPFQAELRDVLADIHQAWLTAYARTLGPDSIPVPRREPRPTPRPPGGRRVRRMGGDGEAESGS